MTLTPGQRFYEGVARHTLGECALEHRGGCDGRLQAHHIYPQQLLKSVAKRHGYDVDEMLADWRNGLFACWRHQRIHTGFERFDRGDMPCVLEAFERAYPALDGLWPRIYRRGLDEAEPAPSGIIP